MRKLGFSMLAAIVGILFVVASARADLAATGSISVSGTGPYTYTITLNNTGDQPIYQFWFAWQDGHPDENFMHSYPNIGSAPSGWFAYPSYNDLSAQNDGFGIQWYNYFGSDLAPGSTTSSFQFTSPDAPSAVFGSSIYYDNPQVTTSTVFDDNADEFNLIITPTPEPATAGLVMMALGGVVLRRRRGVI